MKIAPLMNTEYPAIDRIFNDGWAEYIKGRMKEVDRKNRRLFKAILTVRDEAFVKQVRKFQVKVAKHSLAEIVREPIGMKIGDRRYPLIPFIWVEQTSAAVGGMYIRFCIQITDKKWLLFHTSTD